MKLQKLLLFTLFFSFALQPFAYAMHTQRKERRDRRRQVTHRSHEIRRKNRTKGQQRFEETRSQQSEQDKQESRQVKAIELQDRRLKNLPQAFGSDQANQEPEIIDTIQEDPLETTQSKRRCSVLTKPIICVVVTLLATALLTTGVVGTYSIYRAIDAPTQRAAELETNLNMLHNSDLLQAAYYWQCTEDVLSDQEQTKECIANSEQLIGLYEQEIDFFDNINSNYETHTILPPEPFPPHLGVLNTEDIRITPSIDLENAEIQTEKSLIQRGENAMTVKSLSESGKVIIVKKTSETDTFTLIPLPPGTPPVEDYIYNSIEQIKLEEK